MISFRNFYKNGLSSLTITLPVKSSTPVIPCKNVYSLFPRSKIIIFDNSSNKIIEIVVVAVKDFLLLKMSIFNEGNQYQYSELIERECFKNKVFSIRIESEIDCQVLLSTLLLCSYDVSLRFTSLVSLGTF